PMHIHTNITHTHTHTHAHTHTHTHTHTHAHLSLYAWRHCLRQVWFIQVQVYLCTLQAPFHLLYFPGKREGKSQHLLSARTVVFVHVSLRVLYLCVCLCVHVCWVGDVMLWLGVNLPSGGTG